ncbi:hypothetical protein BKA65DRAFT_535918 [Rhexocercosporidium sp. MPI-PUGE-AT-0058]|nr:hypothetical protein BKA65DRAFT_535918 [Rhexocercosporidium sp. MPI-PUGE-AT-0058]
MPSSTQPQPPPKAKPTNLIIVCCHAIYTGPSSAPSPPSSSPTSCPISTTTSILPPSHPSNWLLAPFQTDEIPTFTAHMQAGLSLLASDTPNSLLVFSGSKTRPEIEKSEARGYLDYCERNAFWGILGREPATTSDLDVIEDSSKSLLKEKELQSNIILEEQALDSFSNLLFSILLFWKKTHTWPRKLTIVSHAFKRPRFMDLHIPTLRFPTHCVTFVGIDPEYMQPGHVSYDEERAGEVRRGERERGFSVWEVDLLGVGRELRGKREGRNCWGVGQSWFDGGVKGEEERERSRAVSWRVEDGDGEEVLGEERQPWEED